MTKSSILCRGYKGMMSGKPKYRASYLRAYLARNSWMRMFRARHPLWGDHWDVVCTRLALSAVWEKTIKMIMLCSKSGKLYLVDLYRLSMPSLLRSAHNLIPSLSCMLTYLFNYALTLASLQKLPSSTAVNALSQAAVDPVSDSCCRDGQYTNLFV